MNKTWFEKADSSDYFSKFMRSGKDQHPSHKYAEDLILDMNLSSIADIGVGSGVTFEHLKGEIINRNIKYIGIDIVDKVVKGLRFIFADYKNADWLVGSLENIPLIDKCVDISYTRHTLEHCNYYKKPISELIRIAKQTVIIVLFHKLQDRRDIIKTGDRYSNYYNRSLFIEFLNNLSYKYTMNQIHNNTVIQIELSKTFFW